MALLTIRILDANGTVKCADSAEGFASLVFRGEYAPGDCIEVESSEKNIHLRLQLDDALGAEFVYMTDKIRYMVPFAEKRVNLSPKAFWGADHYLYVRELVEEEIYQYRNLAKNICDQREAENLFPHATANVETRGEAIFFACNAIDGVCENRSHGFWPYQSWGINRRDDAEITVDFGRLIEADRIVMFTRADFPHDNWWTQVTVSFSDGSRIDWKLQDRCRFAQELTFETKKIRWVRLSHLLKADDPSPFPALSQLEVYGRVAR